MASVNVVAYIRIKMEQQDNETILLCTTQAIRSVENFQTLYTSFVSIFNECSSSPIPSELSFEDAMRRLHLAHQFLLESLTKIQHNSFAMHEICRNQKMTPQEFIGKINTTTTTIQKETNTSTSKENQSPKIYLDLITKKLLKMEENMEVATEILHTIEWTTSASAWTRYALILSRGELK